MEAKRRLHLWACGCAVVACSIAYGSREPRVAAAQDALADARAQETSARVAVAAYPNLLRRRNLEARRYRQLFARDAEIVFLEELATVLRRDGVTASTISVRAQTPSTPTTVNLTLSGDYRSLLQATADISKGSEPTTIQTPSLRRRGESIELALTALIGGPASSAAPATGATP